MGLNFGTDGDVITVADDASFRDQDAFSIVMWVRPTTQTNNRRFFNKVQSAEAIQAVWAFGNNNDIQFEVETDGTVAQVITNENFNTAIWHYLVFTYSNTNFCRVFNGTPQTVATRSAEISSVGSGSKVADIGNDLLIGTRPALNQVFQGDIASLMWINKELTLKEVEALQFRPRNLVDSVIWHEYHGTGTAPDLSGNGNVGVPTQVSVADHVPIASPFGFDAPIIIPTAAEITAALTGTLVPSVTEDQVAGVAA